MQPADSILKTRHTAGSPAGKSWKKRLIFIKEISDCLKNVVSSVPTVSTY